MIQSFNQPLTVIPLDEGTDDHPRLVERVEPMKPETLFFQGADEALHDAVALRLADIRGTVSDPQPIQLGPKRIGDVLRPPVTPNG